MGNVIKFPDLMGQMPHRRDNYLRKPPEMWTPLDGVCHAQAELDRRTAERDAHLENGTTDTVDFITAEVGVSMWSEILEERKATAVDTTLNYAGKIYAEPMGRA